MQPYLGEIRAFAHNVLPHGWLPCNGQIIAITSNQPLFSLLGTYYGGDGRTTFGLPDLRGAAMVGAGMAGGLNYNIGQTGGAETVTLNNTQIPAHNHLVDVLSVAGSALLNTVAPLEALAEGDIINAAQINDLVEMYIPPSPAPVLTALAANTIPVAGSGGAHDNMPPFLTLNVCIATQGLYPPRN